MIRRKFAPAVLLTAVALLEPARARSADGEVNEAKQDFERALTAYDARDYTRALALFQRSYTLSRKPEILFDIAETFAAMGECGQAIKVLDELAHSAASPALLARGAARRQRLEPCSSNQVSAAAAPVPVESAKQSVTLVKVEPAASRRRATTPAVVAASAPSSRRTNWKTIAWTVAGASAACLVAGSIFELEARASEQRVDSATMWDAAAVRDDARGRALDAAGVGLLIAAATAAVTSAVIFWITARGRR